MKSFTQVRCVIGLLASLAVMAWMSAGAHAASVIADWKFDSSGAGLFTDSSGNGNTLQVAPATLQSGNGGADVTNDDNATFVGGGYTIAANNNSRINSSTGYASFDGAASLITVNPLNLSSYNQLTIEWFAKRNASMSGGYNGNFIFYDGDPSSYNGTTGTISFQVTAAAQNPNEEVAYNFGGANVVDGSATPDVWHEYALTYDRTTNTIDFYQDYTLVQTVSNSIPTFLNSDFVIGKDFFYANNGSDRHFNGDVDELSISSGILTPGTFLSETPEPASLGLLAVGGVMLLRRRRA